MGTAFCEFRTAPASPYHARVPGLLEVTDLAVAYETGAAPVRAISEVTFGIDEGEAVGLLGESGGGKSTLLLAVLGLLPARARVMRGSIRWRGRELIGLPSSARRPLRGAEIAIVFQDPNCFAFTERRSRSSRLLPTP